MASDFYLKIDTLKGGAVKGESLVKQFCDQIQVKKFTISMNSPTDYGTNQAAGRINLEHAEFEFETNLASVPLFSTLCTNDVIKTATLTCRKTGQKGVVYTFLQWRFTAARLISFKNASEGEAVTDTIQIAYAGVEVWYGQQKADGSITNGLNSAYDSGENSMVKTSLPDPKPDDKPKT